MALVPSAQLHHVPHPPPPRQEPQRLTSSGLTQRRRSYGATFLDFFTTAPCKTPTFESISGRRSFENALRSRCYRRSCPRKVKKTLHRSVTESPSTDIYINLEPFGTHPRIYRIHPIPPISCQEPRLRSTLPRAPGARMT